MASTLCRIGMATMIGALTTVGTAMAQPSGSEGRIIEGTWFIQVTPTICATGAPVPGVTPINSLVTFHRGGTLTEDLAGLAFAPGQRTGGQGNWSHASGQTFDQRFVALIAFGSAAGPAGPAVEAGWQTVTHTVEMLDRDTLQSSGTNAFYRTDGTVYRTGCSTATGHRFE